MAEKYQSKRSDSILTPEIRWAYPFVHEQSTKRPNGQPRKSPVWIITGLLPKLSADPLQCANYRFLSDLCMQAVSRETSWGGQFPQGGHWPIQDGDAPPKPKPTLPGQPAAAVDPNKGAWRKGHWCFEASTSLSPGPRVCVMQSGQAVEIPAKVIGGRQLYKSGDFGIGSLHAYTFFNEKWGVNFGFEGILWTREGDPIGSAGPRSAAQMFGGVAGMAAPTAPAMPAGMAPVPPSAPQPQYAPPLPPSGAPAYAAPMAPAGAPSAVPTSTAAVASHSSLPPLPPAPPAPGGGLPPIPGR